MGKPEKKLKKILLILGIAGAVYGSFRFLLPPVIPFLLAWALSAILRPSARWLSDHLRIKVKGVYRHLPIGLAGVAELVVFAALSLLGCYLGGRRLLAELSLFMERLPVWIDVLDRWLTNVCHDLENILCLKANVLVLLARDMLKGLFDTLKGAAMPYLMTNSVSAFRWGVEVLVVSVLMLVSVGLCLQEADRWKRRCAASSFHREFAVIGRRLKIVANAWLKTQGIIMLLTTGICTVGLWLIGNPYSILMGIGIGLVDALPVFGTGTVLIPWAVVLFLMGKFWRGLIILVIYLICYFLRQTLEAKLMGDQVGLSALETLIAIYVGLQLFGIIGLFLGPMALLLIEDLVELSYNVNNDKEEGE